MQDWIREHFIQIVAGVVGLGLLSWLYRHAGRLFGGGGKGRSYCRHCNWEGRPDPKQGKCRRCGSTDLAPVTH